MRWRFYELTAQNQALFTKNNNLLEQVACNEEAMVNTMQLLQQTMDLKLKRFANKTEQPLPLQEPSRTNTKLQSTMDIGLAHAGNNNLTLSKMRMTPTNHWHCSWTITLL